MTYFPNPTPPWYPNFFPKADAGLKGKKAVRKTTQAGGGGADLEKLALEQQEKLQREREEREVERERALVAKAAGGDGSDGKDSRAGVIWAGVIWAGVRRGRVSVDRALVCCNLVNQKL